MRAPVLLLVLLLAGCPAAQRPPATGVSDSNVPVPAAPSPAPSPPPAPRPLPPARSNQLSPASRALVTQARSMLAHGNMDGASMTLDRALRIEPKNPLLWIELARLRLLESDSHQAEGCARKALALASGDASAQRQAGQLLADALRRQQRNQEAAEVESRPFMH